MLEVELEGLPPALDGLRIAHLSDFHLGRRSHVATARARAPSTGSRGGGPISSASPATSSRIHAGEPRLRELLGRLERPYVVLGNHDVAVTRDPFSRAAELDGLERRRLLRDDAVDGRARASASRSSASTP